MSVQTTINCPDCNSEILIDSMLLLSGSSFKCPNENCDTSIALASEDIPKVSKAFAGFEQLKAQSLEHAKNGSQNG